MILISCFLLISKSPPQKLSQHLLLGSQYLRSQSRNSHKRGRGLEREGGRHHLPRVVPAAQRRESGRNGRDFTQFPANRNHQPKYAYVFTCTADGKYFILNFGTCFFHQVPTNWMKMSRSILISANQIVAYTFKFRWEIVLPHHRYVSMHWCTMCCACVATVGDRPGLVMWGSSFWSLPLRS